APAPGGLSLGRGRAVDACRRKQVGVGAAAAARKWRARRHRHHHAPAEDRGNAILSTLPLSDLTAIELPLERQRRVALGATVTVTPPGGSAIPLRLVCTHFTNMVLHHLFVLSESGRLRQARALTKALPAGGPLIV